MNDVKEKIDFSKLRQEVVDTNLCCSCGTCAGVCPAGCIGLDEESCLPFLKDSSKCLQCGLCYRACPGRNLPIEQLQETAFGSGYQQRMEKSHFGFSIDKRLIKSTDQNICQKAASGGFVTGFLSYLLENDHIDAAVVTSVEPDRPWRFVPAIVRDKQQIINAANSKYSVVPVNSILSELKKQPGRYAVVGLPCHIQAIRKLQKNNPNMVSNIELCIGLFCGTNMSYPVTRHILNEMRVGDLSQLASYAPRSQPHIGPRAVLKDGTVLKIRSKYDNYWFHLLRQSPLYHSMRCSLCPDYASELADISAGDPRGGNKGYSCVIIRTPEAAKLIAQAQEAGCLSAISEFDNEMHKKNVFCKKRKAFTLNDIRQRKALAAVDYGFTANLSEYPWESVWKKRRFLFVRWLFKFRIARWIFKRMPRTLAIYTVGTCYSGV